MSDHKTMTLTLIVWRQKNANDPGKFETYYGKKYHRASLLSGDA